MNTLELDVSQLGFPARCIRCGRQPTRSITMIGQRGINLGVLWVGRHCTVRLPACGSCATRVLVGRALWFIAPVVLWFAFAIIGYEVFGWGRGKGTSLYWTTLVLGAVGMAFWYMSAFEGRSFHRLFSALWIQQVDPAQGRVTLGFRDEKLRQEVAHHSGRLDMPIPAPPVSDDRGDARATWAPNPHPAWMRAAPGLFIMAVSIFEFVRIHLAEKGTEPFELYSIESVLYEIGGKWLVGAVLLGLGAFVVYSVVWRRPDKR